MQARNALLTITYIIRGETDKAVHYFRSHVDKGYVENTDMAWLDLFDDPHASFHGLGDLPEVQSGKYSMTP